VRFIWRISIFILFPAVVLAIIFLAQISFGTALRFGEWGEKSIAESTLIVTKEKIERIEHMINTTDNMFFRAIRPSEPELSKERWRQIIRNSTLVEAAAIIDEYGDIATFYYHNNEDCSRRAKLRSVIEDDFSFLIERYESLGRYKHLHRRFLGDYLLITYLTSVFENREFTVALFYDNKEIEETLLADGLANVGTDRVANVVDDRNRVIFGRPIDGAGEFIVSRRFPFTFYKWKLQLAPTTAALFSSEAQEKAKRFSQVMLIPLALGVIVLGLAVLYLSIVRERRLNRLKSDFVANVSHELKTPLSLIRMFGELLLMGKVENKQKAHHYHEIIVRETDRLTMLIDNVLNLARIERGKSAYVFEPMNVADAVERAVEIYSHRLDKSGLVLEYSVATDLPLANIDEHAITLAIVNLIDNAAKYAEGTEVVGVEVYSHNKFVHLDVFDRGAGIPSSQLKRVFDRFYRVPSPTAQKQRGSGIGLSLVHHIALGHAGTVEVMSIPGKETRFSIRIPAIIEDA
jgi:two-component system, OmpR family, phosphate regulon sensor histidine kinase PhoR